jgi:hypothetical protein
MGNHLATYKTKEREKESLLNFALGALAKGITTLHYMSAFFS